MTAVRSTLAVALVVALAIVACDIADSVVVRNGTDEAVVAKVVRFGDDGTDSYTIHAGEEVTVGSNGFAGPGEAVRTIVVLDADCVTLLEHIFNYDGANPGGGVVTVAVGPLATFEAGNPPAAPVAPPTSSECD